MTPRLIAISGLPGVGKSSIAAAVASRDGAVHLSIDPVEESILACGLPSGWQVGVAAYEAVGAMAEQNLRLGRDVVVDAVNDSEEARQTWRGRRRAPTRASSSCTSRSPMLSSMSSGSAAGIVVSPTSANRPGRTCNTDAPAMPSGRMRLRSSIRRGGLRTRSQMLSRHTSARRSSDSCRPGSLG
ncbi:AAA family ATPase [Calidifontibacter indicus]|uniref:AAA family ATPase n=1 Tax=Calidifontibacter indicus TaxID=419650 RepID=UPI000E24DF04